MDNKASNIACRAELGRCPLIFEQSSLVIQSLVTGVVMPIDLYRNGKTSFFTNLVKMLNYYNSPFNFNHAI